MQALFQLLPFIDTVSERFNRNSVLKDLLVEHKNDPGQITLRQDLGFDNFETYLLILHIEHLVSRSLTEEEQQSPSQPQIHSEYPVLTNLADAHELYRGRVDTIRSKSTAVTEEPPDRALASIAGRWCELLPATPESDPFAYQLGLVQPGYFRPRWGNRIPKFEDFRNQRSASVLIELVIRDRFIHSPIGILRIYQPNFQTGHARLSLIMIPELEGSAISIEALQIFLKYAFTTWDFRKIMCEVPDYMLPMFPIGTYGFTQMGVFQNRLYSRGRLRNVHVLATDRSAVDRFTRIVEQYTTTGSSPDYEPGVRTLPKSLVGSNGSSPAVLVGRWVELAPVFSSDLQFLHTLQMNPELNYRWRYRGAQVPIETISRTLWDDVLIQFIVRTRRSKKQVGLVVAYNANIESGYTYIGSIVAPEVQRAGLASDAVDVFIQYLKCNWRIEDIYFETPGYNVPQFRRALRDLEEEVVVHDQMFHDGRYWNMHHFRLNPEGSEIGSEN